MRPTSVPSGNEGEQKNEPVQEEPTGRDTTIQQTTGETPSNVVVRVSGTPGTAYQGSYSTSSEVQTVDGTVGDEPTDYDANVKDVDKSTLTAVFRKTQSGDEGTLQVGIVSDGEVIAESATSAELGEVSVKWPSQESELKGTTLPGEFEPRRSR
jgi:hypothetical protein